jgi:hypothetical protein
MKFLITAALIVTIAAGFVLAQGPSGSYGGVVANDPFLVPYDQKRPPSMGLSGAYQMAIEYVGPATNQFYCVSASCLEKNKSGLPGWTFSFCNTNGQRVGVQVPFSARFDRHVSSDNDELLHGK